jgi:hypothetical protein
VDTVCFVHGDFEVVELVVVVAALVVMLLLGDCLL